MTEIDIKDKTPEQILEAYYKYVTARCCASTFSPGWMWYCDTHDSHGSADSEEEAGFMADMHSEYWAMEDADSECPEAHEDCDIWVAAAKERDEGS